MRSVSLRVDIGCSGHRVDDYGRTQRATCPIIALANNQRRDLYINTGLTSFHVHDLIDSQNALVR